MKKNSSSEQIEFTKSHDEFLDLPVHKDRKFSRENLKLTEQMAEMLKAGSEDLKISKNELVSIAIFDFLQNADNFVICEKCKSKIAIKQILQGSCGIIEMPCKCGIINYYDFDNDTIVKTK